MKITPQNYLIYLCKLMYFCTKAIELTRKQTEERGSELPKVGDELDPRWLDRPRSRLDRSGAETPTAALRRLKEQKANTQPIKVILPRESDHQLDSCNQAITH
jgi:hypothetical protein